MASQKTHHSPQSEAASNNVQTVNSHRGVEPVPGKRTRSDKPVVQQAQTGFRIEPELLEIFTAETQQHISTVESLLGESEAPEQNMPVSGELTRALHTLSGSARTAEVSAIAELCEPLECYAKARCEINQAIPAEVVPLLKQVTHTIRQVLEALKNPNVSMPETEVLCTQLVQLMEQESVATASGQTPVHPLAVAVSGRSTNAEEIKPLLDDQAGVGHSNQPIESLTGAPDIPDEQDQELVEIFLEEAGVLLDDLDNTLQAWSTKPKDKSSLEQLQRQLHTLKGAARMARYSNIGDLSHSLESLIIEVVESRLTPNQDLFEVLFQVADRLHVMLKDAENAQPVYPAPELIQALEQLKTGGAIEQGGANPDQVESSMLADSTSTDRPILGTPDMPDEQDLELVEIFLEEANDLLDDIDNSLQAWGNAPQDLEVVKGLQRHLHTLKGGARMAGYSSIGDLSHSLESLILAVVETRLKPIPEVFEVFHQSLDRLHSMHKEAKNAQPVFPALDLITALDQLKMVDPVAQATAAPAPVGKNTLESGASPAQAIDEPAQSQSAATAIDHAVTPGTKTTEQLTAGAQAKLSRGAGTIARGESQELIRVPSELLDNLVNNAGEVNIYHARLGQQISGFSYNLNELEQTVVRLRNQLRNLEIETEAQILFRYEQEKEDNEAEFDPLELDRYSTIQQLSRALGESVGDLVSIQEILIDVVRDAETLLLQQSRVSTDLQEGLMRSRMVKFASVAPRLRRIARQTARELGKKVNLHLSGENSELDRSVLDRMIAPLEHMLRNAISHGIDSPDKRTASGRTAMGNIRVNVNREGSEIVIRVEDDGAGINLKAVKDKALKQGLLSAEQKLSDHDIMQFILESGFSTARQVTQISGRGVGMDVVSSEIKQLGGVLSIDSAQGKGTVFTVRLPFTLAINQALLVQSSDDLYAVPLASIEGIVRLTAGELKTKYAESNPTYEYAANEYKLKHLGALLGMSQPMLNDPHSMVPVLLVRSGEQRVALQTEGLVGSREIVVKTVGPQISKVRGISGATILGDGRVVLILDVAGLIRIGAGLQPVSSAQQREAPAAEDKLSTVMVVDDSITIRKVTSRILERNNYAVLTAKDGVDAVSQLQEHVPDLFLLDIEMPRMDGYELATHIRNNDRFKKIPIIMITSRTGEKHRQRAMGIGVNKYLGKPYQEAELLENIKEMLGR